MTNWKDVGWDNYYERTDPGSFSSFGTKFRLRSRLRDDLYPGVEEVGRG